jgi:hypothetical protein
MVSILYIKLIYFYYEKKFEIKFRILLVGKEREGQLQWEEEGETSLVYQRWGDERKSKMRISFFLLLN